MKRNETTEINALYSGTKTSPSSPFNAYETIHSMLLLCFSLFIIELARSLTLIHNVFVCVFLKCPILIATIINLFSIDLFLILFATTLTYNCIQHFTYIHAHTITGSSIALLTSTLHYSSSSSSIGSDSSNSMN